MSLTRTKPTSTSQPIAIECFKNKNPQLVYVDQDYDQDEKDIVRELTTTGTLPMLVAGATTFVHMNRSEGYKRMRTNRTLNVETSVLLFISTLQSDKYLNEHMGSKTPGQVSEHRKSHSVCLHHVRGPEQQHTFHGI